MPTIEEIISQSNAQNALLSSGVNFVTEAYNQLGQQQKQIASSTQSFGDAESVIATQKEAGELEAQEASRTAARAFRSDVADPTQIVTQLAAEMDAYFNAARQSAARIDAAEGAGKTSPLQGIKNLFTLPKEYENYNANVDQYNLIASHLERVNQLTQMQAKTQADIAPTKTVATVQAITQVAKAKTDIAVTQANQQALLYNVQGVEKVIPMSQQELQNSSSAFQMQETQKSRELQRQSLDIAMQERLERVQAKKETEEEQEELANDVRIGMAMSFGDKAPNVPTKLIIRNLQGQNPNAEYVNYMRSGQRQRLFGESIINEDPGKAAIFIASTRAPLAPQMQKVKSLLLESLGEAASGNVAPGVILPVGFDKTKIDQVAGLARDNAIAITKSQAKRIDFADASNIYQAPSLTSIAAVKGVQETGFYKKVLKTQVENGLTQTDPTAIIKLAAESVRNGTVTLNEAAYGISAVFNAAVGLNNKMNDYKRVGLPEQREYNAVINTSEPLFSVTVKNLVEPSEVTSVLSKELLAKYGSTDLKAAGISTTIFRNLIQPQSKN